MSTIFIAIAAFVGVSALVGGVAVMLRGDSDSDVEDRLEALAGLGGGSRGKDALSKSVLSQPLENNRGAIEEILARYGNIQKVFDQADVSLTVPKFLAISGGLGVGGTVAFALAGIPYALAPLMGLMAAALPLGWIMFRRGRRLKKFASQLPEALELLSRALRAGHSLSAGINLVATEMREPICQEFGRVFEESNLGIPMEDALESMSDRVPNLDLRFFVTAVILQRQTGGDLAEILDKIGHLIRERFQIWGQVQALTGEGRLSGIVLLALPPALFVAVYRLNPDYMMVLFTDEMGKQMLIGGVIMQLLGAVVIRKIVNIKV